jgi:hypothetical protein
MEARQFGHPNPSGFLLLIYPSEWGGGGCGRAQRGGAPLDPASVVARDFGRVTSDPTLELIEH